MNKKIIILSILFLLFLSVACLLAVSPKGKIILATFNMKEVESKIYVDPDMSQDEIDGLLKDLESSKEIVHSYFDGIVSSPTILFIESDEMLEKYGDISGATYDTFFGSYILFGPRGFSTEIITHELVHSELRSRVPNKEIPTWFDEGLATFIDGRFQSEMTQWNKEKGKSEQVYDWTTQNLFRDTSEPILERYELAAYEVGQWYEENGSNGLLQLISTLNEDTNFLSLYKGVSN